jgi:hypothetical protein
VPPETAQPQPRAAALLLAGVLFVGGTGVAAMAARPQALPARSPVSAGAPASSAAGHAAVAPAALSQAGVAAVQPLLDARAAAVVAGRRTGWLAPLLPAAGAFRTRQAQVFDRIRQLPVERWSYRVQGTTALRADRAASLGAEAFVAQVLLSYRLAGDTRDVERRQYLTVARTVTRTGAGTETGGGAGWALADDVDGPTEPALWDIADLTVAHGRRSLVIGLGHGRRVGAQVRQTAREADVSAAGVDAVWGAGWPRTVVLVVPQTLEQMAEVLGRTDATGRPMTAGLDQVAAVTSGELTRCCNGSSGVADRVVVNPVPFARLSAIGRRVVLTHELTHVATRAAARITPPLWVEEGFANYVGYRRSGLAPALIAVDLAPLVRNGTAEPRLPSSAAFDPAGGRIAPAYADSWLAFDLMARTDPDRAAAFFRVAAGLPARPATGGAGAQSPPAPGVSGPASSKQALAAAFSQVLGTDQARFEATWRRHRAAVLRGVR